MRSTRINPVRLLSSLLLLSLHATAADAQQQSEGKAEGVRTGGYAHVLLVNQDSDFSRLPGVPNCCSRFTGGSGNGFDLGGLLLVPFGRRWEVDGRVGITLQSVRMREEESTTVILGGVPTDGLFEHQLDLALTSLEFAPGIAWRPLDLPLRFHLGPALGYVLSGSFDQREVLLEPEDVGTFENNRRVRNEQAGDIPDLAPLWLAIQGGVSWEVPLNASGTLQLAPEIRYSRGLVDHIPDTTWSSHWLALGASIRFGSRPMVPEPETIVVPPPVDTIVVEETPEVPRHSASIVARGVSDAGVESAIATLRVEEFISTNMRPLLNYVFFEENVHVLPPRYIRLERSATGDFDVDRLHSVPVIRTYHHVLNIVGQRMREHPEATVRLTGTNDGLGELEGGRDLSRRRAESVREYLRQTWGIDTARLPIRMRDLPASPSNTEVPDGIEENRRVELESDTWAVLEPVVTVDTLRLTNPPKIRIRPETDYRGPVASWRIDVRQGSDLLRSFGPDDVEGGLQGDRLPESITWNLSDDQRNLPRTDAPISFELLLLDSAGTQIVSRPDTLRVTQLTVSEKRRERRDDRYIDRYSLILFDFDRAELNRANDTIARFIRSRIAPGASVVITGQTDRIGEEEYNLRLSRGRASSTAIALGLPQSVATGEGENVEIYDNALPEGRFYSRTVRIIVETPVESAPGE